MRVLLRRHVISRLPWALDRKRLASAHPYGCELSRDMRGRIRQMRPQFSRSIHTGTGTVWLPAPIFETFISQAHPGSRLGRRRTRSHGAICFRAGIVFTLPYPKAPHRTTQTASLQLRAAANPPSLSGRMANSCIRIPRSQNPFFGETGDVL